MASAITVVPARVRGRAAAYEWSDVLAASLAFGLTVGLAAASGGYFARTWGLSALVLSWIAALGLVLRERIYLGRLEQVALGAFAALLGWTALSSLWSGSASPSLREAGRTAIYVACLLAALVIVRSRSYRTLLIGVWAAAALICVYGLATRLFPERLADPADFAGYRL